MSRKNGRHKLPRHTPEPKSPVLVALEQRLEKAERKLVEAVAYTDDLVSGWERERDEILNGGRLAGRLGARKDGDNWPYLTTMEDLVAMRAASREACEGNGYGAGMLDRAVDFVVGDGMQPEVTLIGVKKGAVATGVADADGDGRPDADPAVENVMGVIEEFRRLNDWGMGEEDREEEGFRRSQRDGEVFLRFFAVGNTNGIPLVRWVEPEQVEAPPGGSEWRWGIKYRKINGVPDVESKEAVYVRTPDGTDGDWVPMREVVYHKLGTDRTVLRGMPQFWLVARALYQSDALNSALAEVSAIQAKIAYVREHAPGIMPGQITDFVGGTGDGMGVKRTVYGDKYRRTGISEEGTIVDMTYGTKFGAGPVSTGVPAFVQALQSRLRQVCARFGYPEFFTGDASNNNYASSLTAGGPAEKAFKRKQHKYAAFQAAVYRRACEYAVAENRLSAADLAAVEIKVKASGVAIANKLEEAQVQQIRIQNKTLSPQTAMVENGHDPKVELANIKAFDDQFGMGAMGLGGMGGQEQGPFAGGFAEEGVKQEIGPPPFDGAVFDQNRHRWVKPDEKGGNKPPAHNDTMLDNKEPHELTRDEYVAQETAIPKAYGVWNDEVGDDRYAKRVSQTDKLFDKVVKQKMAEVTPGGTWPFPSVVVRRDAGPYELKDGHHRVEVAKRLGMRVIPATLVDQKAFGHTRPVNTFVEIDDEGNPKVIQPNNESLPPIKVTVPEKKPNKKKPDHGKAHLAAVKAALAAGKTVPPEVLSDYPGLAAKHGKTIESVDGGGFDGGQLLEPITGESYTQEEYHLLSEAARAGLTLTQVGTHPRTGKPVMRWVRPAPKGGGTAKPDRATARDTATRLVRDGVKTAADAKLLSDSLKQMTAADIDAVKREFQARTGGRLKQEKVDRLVAYARGRGSVQQTAAPTPTPTAPLPVASELERTATSVISNLFATPGKSVSGQMVTIADVRRAVRSQYGESAAGKPLNDALNRMDLAGKIRMVEIDDRSRASGEDIADAIPQSSGLLFYIKRGAKWTN